MPPKIARQHILDRAMSSISRKTVKSARPRHNYLVPLRDREQAQLCCVKGIELLPGFCRRSAAFTADSLAMKHLFHPKASNGRIQYSKKRHSVIVMTTGRQLHNRRSSTERYPSANDRKMIVSRDISEHKRRT
jgi:hypothetical protein